jgi:hypothetical protein
MLILRIEYLHTAIICDGEVFVHPLPDIVKELVDNLPKIVKASGCDLYFEEGACWGMAFAIRNALADRGMVSTLRLLSPGVHALVECQGFLLDYQGEVLLPANGRIKIGQPLLDYDFMVKAIRHGWTEEDIEHQIQEASELVEAALEMVSLTSSLP